MMASMVSSNPARRGLLFILPLVLILSASTFLYVKLTDANPPRWVDLTIPLNAALLGLLSLFPEFMRLSLVWRRCIAIFFFALSAVELILFFVKG
jgi:hypothetical protein